MTSTNQKLQIVFAALMVLLLAAPVSAGDRDRWPPTILDRLLDTDGAQALVAAVLVVDDAGVLDFSIAELLDDKRADVVLFAPGNPAFEALLQLEPGTLDGLDAATIAGLLPGILDGLGLTASDVAAVLLKHAALPRKVNRATAREAVLLRKGEIEVADGSVFPIGVGGQGVRINRESSIVVGDVFTRNGVIHFIDRVIVDDAL